MAILDETMKGLIARWNELVKRIKVAQEALAPDIAAERELRKQVAFGIWDPSKNEGTKWEDYNGMRLKGNIKLDRKVDEAAYLTNHARMWENGINPAVVFKVEHSLISKEYKNLTAEQQKIVDEVIAVKPASPELELLPAKAG